MTIPFETIAKWALLVLAVLYGAYALILWQKTKKMNRILVTRTGEVFNYLTLGNLIGAGVIILLILAV
jgi:hypothetical protein